MDHRKMDSNLCESSASSTFAVLNILTRSDSCWKQLGNRCINNIRCLIPISENVYRKCVFVRLNEATQIRV